MLSEAIRTLLMRELRTLAREVDAYPTDALLWRLVPGIPNSGGTLALHLAGNLEHFVGAVLGGTGYVRDRDAEFSTRELARAEVRARVESAARAVDAALSHLTAERCEASYPMDVGGRPVRAGDFLVHLVAHTAYHVGQIDYHRRFLDPDAQGVGAVSTAELPRHATALDE